MAERKENMKQKKPRKVLVCGAGGFIGHHLVKRLKGEGYWVRGVDIKRPAYEASPADEFLVLDLRDRQSCIQALVTTSAFNTEFCEVYQLAADMGGMGFIHNEECDILSNSTLINMNMANVAIRQFQVDKYFFSSSACVYKDQASDHIAPLTEEDAYPANPHNEYGWEKLFAERVATTYAKHTSTKVRIARFQNCYGPLGTWSGGREKAPAALCRKVAELDVDGVTDAWGDGTIDVWGDGTAVRAYTYINDLIDGIRLLMLSELDIPVNIGRVEYASVDGLVATIAKVANKTLRINHVKGPVGVAGRFFTNDKLKSLGWKSRYSLLEGLSLTYPWVKKQVEQHNASHSNPQDLFRKA